MQREFLWGGVGGGKISWVKWKPVCQKKENGGCWGEGYSGDEYKFVG